MHNMDNILVPVDFSDASFHAADYAALLSNIFNSNIILLHAFMNPIDIDEMRGTLINQPWKELWQVKEEQLNEYAEILRKKYTIRIRPVLKEGMATPAILEVARDENAALIVMGMKGKGKSKSIFGSNTTSVMRKSSAAVLVIPESVKFKSIEVITLACDFDIQVASGIYFLLRKIALKNDAFIQILNVRKKKSRSSADERVAKRNVASAFENVRHQFYTIQDDEVNEGIENFLREHPADVLVMMIRKRNFFERILQGSHTKKMSYETQIPLLVLQDNKLDELKR